MTDTPAAPVRDPQKLVYIDALRGIAVLGVVAFHAARLVIPFPDVLKALTQQGKFGVQLFFVVSAFTLFLSLSVRRSVEAHPVRNFFLRRFFRIAPLFWCAMVFYLLLEGVERPMADVKHITPLNILAHAAFLNGWSPYWINSILHVEWSVAVEMSFYLMVPFLFQRIRSLKAAVVFTFLTLLLSLGLARMGHHLVPAAAGRAGTRFLEFWLPSQIPVFGMGFVLFFISQRLRPRLPHLRMKREKAGLMVAAVILLCALGAFVSNYFLAHFLYGVVFVAMAVALIIHPFRIFVNGFTVCLGKISYSVYLTHSAVLPLALKFITWCGQQAGGKLPPLVEYTLAFSATLFAAVAVSALTYRLIERPGQNLGRRVIDRLEKRGAPTVPPVLDAGV